MKFRNYSLHVEKLQKAQKARHSDGLTNLLTDGPAKSNMPLSGRGQPCYKHTKLVKITQSEEDPP